MEKNKFLKLQFLTSNNLVNESQVEHPLDIFNKKLLNNLFQIFEFTCMHKI